MLEQALVVLAAAGGTAVVAGLREAMARWFGRGDGRRQQAELERLDQTVTALQTTNGAEAERVRLRQEAAWQVRIEAALEGMDEAERDRAADELRTLLAQHVPAGGVSAGSGGLAVGGNADIRAEGGSIAAGVINGGAHIGDPPLPDPSQG
jgi:hypothetical protein